MIKVSVEKLRFVSAITENLFVLNRLLFGILIFFSISETLLSEDLPLFRFIQISDQHFVDAGRLAKPKWVKKSKGIRKFTKVPDMTKEFISWTNSHEIAFVLMTGDVLENYSHAKESLPEFIELHRQLKMPYFITTGNHDFGVDKKIPADKGGRDFYFTCGGMIFVGIPTFISKYSAMVDIVPEEAMNALLEISIEKYPSNPVMVFTHAPLFKGKGVPDWAPPYNAEQVQKVLEKCRNLIAVLTGHMHAFNYSIHNDIHYFVAPGFVEAPEFGFLLFNVYRDKISCDVYQTKSTPFTILKSVHFQIPQNFQKNLKTPSESDLKALPLPDGNELLKKIMGKHWPYCPGIVPISWENEVVLLPQHSSGWEYTLVPPDKSLTPDTNGKNWFDPGYETTEWKKGSLPMLYKYRWNKTTKVKVGTSLEKVSDSYWRSTLNVSSEQTLKDKQAMLKVASDKNAEVYINGKCIDNDSLIHRADYWNRYILFNSSILKQGENLVAVKVRSKNTWTSHLYFDIEIVLNPQKAFKTQGVEK